MNQKNNFPTHSNYRQPHFSSTRSPSSASNQMINQLDQLIDECYLKTEMFWYSKVDQKTIKQLNQRYLLEIKQAALQGNKKACYLLGRYYGSAVYEKNQDLAKQWLLRAYEKGEGYCIYNLYILEQNKEKKRILLEEAANKFDPRALCQLGKIYLFPQNGKQKEQSLGMEWLKIAQSSNFPEAYYLIGKYCMLINNYQQAIKYLKKAYEIDPLKFQNAESLIASSYSNLKNFQESEKWLRNRHNSVSTRSYLVRIRNCQKLGKKQEQKNLLNDAVFINDNDASNLGSIYYHYGASLKDEKTLLQRFKCYELGAKLGNKDCIAVCGLLYYRGEGVEQDQQKGGQMILESVEKRSKIGKRLKQRLNL